ncbi:polyamine ABC transporter substrate-binding protein [Solirhodobacter olei]|uniref:polyamine ABC transporter substrate-binding protein n=1 Tax=Solirhodobacter olei TaxID=2493082 RepID=UPI001F4D8D3C|nr:polyamine ABC transporter substrate-binding protein [Solirhodobacter olei]
MPAIITGARRAEAADENQLTIVSWGGSYQDAQSKAEFEPAAKALGITVKQQTYSGLAELRLRVKSGAGGWDVVSSGSGTAARAGKEGLLEKLDYSVIDAKSLISGTAQPYYIGNDVFSTVVGWSTKTFGKNGPQNWVDFWDVRKFPGSRAYRNNAMLEPALMADGVPMHEVYKVLSTEAGLKRAIDKMKQLKPHIAVWWSSGAQSAQLMKDGAVDMIAAWNGRLDAANKDGAACAYTYEQGLLDTDCFVIPKGTKKRDLAMRFIAEISKPKYQADLTKYITYGPTNEKAYDLTSIISPAYAAQLPSSPANTAKQLLIDDAWYMKYYQKAQAAYQDMITG